ncbi:unnamed protein product [Microthlaspi erraticum]|uniref:Uncharacterized protein n=1 Tax=Microthlaspi erraticum TaxID=1685480 RepID=A0A6D2JRE7_9BRAS|nr:unnamed protein product [Microthlaspi erraticum]
MSILRQSYCFSGNIAFYFFFLLSLVLHTLASPVLHYCRHDHRDALLEFKHEFPTNELESRSLSSWIKSNDCCSWEGVTCDDKSGEVISLDLSFIPLNNSLKPYSGIFKLHHLRNLILRECHVYGDILSSLGNLSHLTHLDLKGNHLVGEVPASVRNLTQLRYIDLSKNKFTGKIPVSFANLTNLSHLDISLNHFTGENFPLPFDMSQFHNLEYFDVGGNSFSGTFPTSLFMIPSLRWVSLWGNNLKGPIEFKNTSSSSKLQTLSLYQNNFEGSIPKSISKFSNLERLLLSDNYFTGPILRSISNMVKLVTLDLSHNNFIGPIPISNLVNLLSLDLSGNKLEGEIPVQIPSEDHYHIGLTTLRLQNNNLSGIIPPDLFANATTWLESVDVSSNQLKGKLPKSLSNCTHLKLLNVGSNKIKDKFPCWLRSLPSLHVMSLRSNQFYGPLYHHNVSIGFQSLKIIDISHNDFSGTLPPFYFSN